jgi:hypothetical protein
MNPKLTKLQRLTQIISDRQPLGIFTLRDGQFYHRGQPLTHEDKTELEKQYDKSITINVKIKC